MCVPEVEAPVMTSVKIVPDDSSFAAGKHKYGLLSTNHQPHNNLFQYLSLELEAADSKLVVVDFTAEWWVMFRKYSC